MQTMKYPGKAVETGKTHTRNERQLTNKQEQAKALLQARQLKRWLMKRPDLRLLSG